MTMEDWSQRLDLFLMADDREILQDAGKLPQKSRGQKRNVNLKSTVSFRIGSFSQTMTVIYWN